MTTRAGWVTVNRIGTAPCPPTKRALSTRSWRTTSTCPSATWKVAIVLAGVRLGSSWRSGSSSTICPNASTALGSESTALYALPSSS
ncbi:MAG: hypothetical protein AUH42_02405 [Gemmatimonadetes bacterium 13_1_40CM_70_11]|nr:MAG: hypothetical protein AUH42_02405 [Gemmatimonadetes bacterium 13_1_40CM_70_11]